MYYDPQHFVHEQLPNGIDFYTHTHASSVCFMDIFIPVGSAHATAHGPVPPGSPHFLEHALFLQSKNHAEAHSFDLDLALRGCERTGTTYAFMTRYGMACPLSELTFASNALFETVYEPLFSEECLAPERGVVQNERDREKKYFPGRNRIHQYVNTEFRHSSWVTLQQIFGTNADLKQYTPEKLAELHQLFNFHSGTKVVAVGKSDFSELKKLIGSIRTHRTNFPQHFTPSHWVDPAFRYVELEGVKHPTYISSWMRPALPNDEFVALMFLLKYLVNHVHGPLYDEFRKRKGWTYGISHFCDASDVETIYGFDLMLQDKEQIEEVRKTLIPLARKSMEDQERVERELRRRLAFEAFSYQTSDDIISGARSDVLSGDPIRTYASWKKSLARLKDPEWRISQFETLFSEDSFGDLALMPKE
ncbi:MAG: M16 family metallopeptidase [Candidatus Paceibacterota bacterium]